MKTVFGIAFALLVAGGSQAAFVKQPYLQNLTDTSIVVRWETGTAQTGKVQFGLTAGYGLEVTHSNSATQHELQLPGLIRDTLYHYRAISGSDTSADAVLHTPVASSKPFQFIAYGDTRTDSASHQSVINRMALVSPSPWFVLQVGDLTADATTPEYQTFFNIVRGVVARDPMYPAIGNHDVADTVVNWHTFFALPNNEHWYSFRYGNSAFHCLDNYSTYSTGSVQYNWFLSELLADSADPSIRHIFVWFHEPPYTTNTGHSSNTTIRQYISPLLERFHVQLAFQGHNHCYEHSLVNGVHYIITGGGGAPLYTGWGQAQSWTVYREATYEFVLVDVRGDTIFSRGIRPDGTGLDTLQIITSRSGIQKEIEPVRRLSDQGIAPRPNPFNLFTTVPGHEAERFNLYDASGRLAGSYKGARIGEGLAPGVYFLSEAPFAGKPESPAPKRVRIVKVR